jgi:hypothetical protein
MGAKKGGNWKGEQRDMRKREGEEWRCPSTLQIKQNQWVQKNKEEERVEKNQAEHPQHVLSRHPMARGAV